jgi:predicted regulator of Ras-like GTPase activity (Roadblock/LC7/MglB family)
MTTTIREVVHALSARDGVETTLVLGRDGLPIDSVSGDGVDIEGLAALVPSVVDACRDLAEVGDRGAFHTSVVECELGFIIVSAVTSDSLLAVLANRDANLGPLLFELRRYQSAIAGLL